MRYLLVFIGICFGESFLNSRNIRNYNIHLNSVKDSSYLECDTYLKQTGELWKPTLNLLDSICAYESRRFPVKIGINNPKTIAKDVQNNKTTIMRRFRDIETKKLISRWKLIGEEESDYNYSHFELELEESCLGQTAVTLMRSVNATQKWATMQLINIFQAEVLSYTQHTHRENAKDQLKEFGFNITSLRKKLDMNETVSDNEILDLWIGNTPESIVRLPFTISDIFNVIFFSLIIYVCIITTQVSSINQLDNIMDYYSTIP